MDITRYKLYPNELNGGYAIRRLDDDGYERSVAFIENDTQWTRFCVAYRSNGGDEVSAVHAIDDPHA
jgi:hypothetical protein